MTSEYRIEPARSQLIVTDPWGERVETYPTEDAAKRDIERCKNEDAIDETAQQSVDPAFRTVG